MSPSHTLVYILPALSLLCISPALLISFLASSSFICILYMCIIKNILCNYFSFTKCDGGARSDGKLWVRGLRETFLEIDAASELGLRGQGRLFDRQTWGRRGWQVKFSY